MERRRGTPPEASPPLPQATRSISLKAKPSVQFKTCSSLRTPWCCAMPELRVMPNCLEAQDANGRKTTYSVDAKTALITRIEFVIGQSRDPFSGGMVSDME